MPKSWQSFLLFHFWIFFSFLVSVLTVSKEETKWYPAESNKHHCLLRQKKINWNLFLSLFPWGENFPLFNASFSSFCCFSLLSYIKLLLIAILIGWYFFHKTHMHTHTHAQTHCYYTTRSQPCLIHILNI